MANEKINAPILSVLHVPHFTKNKLSFHFIWNEKINSITHYRNKIHPKISRKIEQNKSSISNETNSVIQGIQYYTTRTAKILTSELYFFEGKQKLWPR